MACSRSTRAMVGCDSSYYLTLWISSGSSLFSSSYSLSSTLNADFSTWAITFYSSSLSALASSLAVFLSPCTSFSSFLIFSAYAFFFFSKILTQLWPSFISVSHFSQTRMKPLQLTYQWCSIISSAFTYIVLCLQPCMWHLNCLLLLWASRCACWSE